MTNSRGLSQKILVVDDEEDLRNIVMDVLKIQGFVPLEAPDGLSAIAIVKKESPDAVILDLNMPGMDGIETLRELKRISPSLPVVVLTANRDIPVAVKAMKSGAFNFITKPPVFEDIISIIKEAAGIMDSSGLSARERETLAWVKEGKSNFEIGKILGIKESTIKTHVESIFEKLGANSKAQAVSLAYKKGLF